MLETWIEHLNHDTDPLGAMSELRQRVEAASDEEIPSLISELTETDQHELVPIPLHEQDVIRSIIAIMERLQPDDAQGRILARKFPLTWNVSVMGGNAFDVRVLLNGLVMVRSHHRVLGPDMGKGVMRPLDTDRLADLTKDIATLRKRNTKTQTSCFPMTRTNTGIRLLGNDETLDITAQAWGQTIAVCALEETDLAADSPLYCDDLKAIGARARNGVVFLRFFGDRVDIIPAARLDDDLDVFLEEMAVGGLSGETETGCNIGPPLAGDALQEAVLRRMEDDIEPLSQIGIGVHWMRTQAMKLLAVRLVSVMTWQISNFGFGVSHETPRRAVPLPEGVEEAIGTDAELRHRSICLHLQTHQDTAQELIIDEEVDEIVSDTLEDILGEMVEVSVKGRVDQGIGGGKAGALVDMSSLSETFDTTLQNLMDEAESVGGDVDEVAAEVDLSVVLLIDFPAGRPCDMTLAAVARNLSAKLGETVRLFLTGRGDYIAYSEGEADSGAHDLFRLSDDHYGKSGFADY